MKKKKFTILSLDGGGFAGVTSATLLTLLELNSTHFDLIAGTSTGALLGAGLRIGKKPTDILRLYRNKGEEIFPGYFERLLDGRFTMGLIRPKYSLTPLRSAVEDVFAGWDLGLVDKTIVTAYNIRTKEFVAFKSWKSEHAKQKLADVVLSSASAPLYFPANGDLVDGGVVVNNPAMVAVTSAIRLGVRLADIRLLSIGTGHRLTPMPKISSHLGAISWGVRFPSMTLQGSSQVVDYSCIQLLGDNYVRLDTPLESASDSMDLATAKQYRNLTDDTLKYYHGLGGSEWAVNLRDWIKKSH